ENVSRETFSVSETKKRGRGQQRPLNWSWPKSVVDFCLRRPRRRGRERGRQGRLGDVLTLKFHEFDLPLAHVFSISRESTSVPPRRMVELTDGTHRGFGEATTNKYYHATLEKMKASLETVRAIVEAAPPLDPPQLWEKVAPKLLDNPFSLCALDEAAYDLW